MAKTSDGIQQQEEFTWIPVYEAIATKLLDYRDNHGALVDIVEQILGERFNDMDPFTFFSMFNWKLQQEDKRIDAIKTILAQFDLDMSLPGDFDGIPVTNPQHWQYWDDRIDTVEHNWEMFEAAMRCADEDVDDNADDDAGDDQDAVIVRDFIAAFNRMDKQDDISLTKLTKGLFWIRPEAYLPIYGDLEKYLAVKLQIELPRSVDGEVYLEFLGELSDLTSKTPYRLSYEAQQSDYWYPPRKKRDNGIDAEQWEQILRDSTITTANNLITLKCLAENPEGMTCAELGDRYGRGMHFYLSNISTLGEKVAKKVGLAAIDQPNNSYAYYSVLCLGQSVAKHRHGTYAWKLRPEVMEALKNMDLSSYPLYADKPETSTESESSPISKAEVEPYGDKDFLDDVFLTSDDLGELKGLLERKKNVILQGAPGTGKTFAAKRLAWDMLGCKDDGHIKFVQFHQNTSYDEFVYGYRPTDDGNGFKMVPGVFVEFVREAIAHPDESYFFIIDEINRANISKVFGELLMTIEEDHRGPDESVTLTVSQEPFYVPENLYIIGMMNTADRGLALIDYALRRRFAFFTMKPALDNKKFQEQLAKRDDSRLTALVEAVRSLNRDIAEDDALGEGFCIGHSYFCENNDGDDDNFARSIARYELIPLIQEYWFDNKDKVDTESNKLLECVK
ncbi:AAA family ATPase [Bifidobacterium sp. ESL0769]|uniref:AAA family ATPase n=1 Tax=Bifidobacterium sp. ESL0769 TaxID=2983229 RepID=UPI0023F6CCC5|nr:AAA family ATPase [Bifidobacterium sp. ESL0769]WEV66793.1 AAA family ATPase [Bifidobacterium sp. ESL0769]